MRPEERGGTDDLSAPPTQHSLRVRILLVALLPLLAAVALFAFYFAHRSVSQAEQTLETQGQEAARRLAASLAFDWTTGNLPQVKRLLELERQSLNAPAIALTDGTHWLLVSGGLTPLPALSGGTLPAHQRASRLHVFAQPLQLQGGEKLDSADSDPYLGGATQTPVKPIHVVVALSRSPVDLMRSQVTLAAIGMAVFCIALATLLAWRLAGGVSKPLQAMTRTVSRLAQGHWTERIHTRADGEIGQLQDGINQMAMTLEDNQRALEQRVLDATSELRGQKQFAESANQAKSRFLAAASHDLRQPLHALSLLVEALQEKVPDGEAKRLASHIEASAHGMESLLNSLLDLSRLDAGAIVASPKCFPINQALENLQRQFNPQVAARGLSLSIRPSKVWVYTDPVLLEQILANLLANALRYTETGGIVVGVRRIQEEWIRLEVWDTGKGISREFQNQVFEEYFQLANPERHRDKGLGLGLAIVARLARLLGSQVQLRSEPGRGSCFHLRLARCQAFRASTDASPPSTPTMVPLEQALVAFIDDEESILEAMVEVFDHWGVALAVGEDAEQVKRDLLELGRKPDLILSDYRLKDGHTGIQAVALLREAFGPIPAALLTGDTSPESIQILRESGLPVLHKPLKPAKLRAFLAHLLAGNPIPPPTT